MPEQKENMDFPEQREIAFFGPWVGELGWELMTWQAWCRAQASNFKKCYVCSFPEMYPLYEDFATFIPHSYPKRHLDWTNTEMVQYDIPEGAVQIHPFKKYIVEGQDFKQFGTRKDMPDEDRFFILHARGINKGGKNYPLDMWEALVQNIEGKVACVGTDQDHHVKGALDLRNSSLYALMDILANSKVVIGQSSGVMHLAALCGAPLIVWGDTRTYFGETLEKRYAETWNPFKVPVSFLYHDEWKPPVSLLAEIIRLGDPQYQHPGEIQRQVLKDMGKNRVLLPTGLRDALQKATDKRRFFVTVTWLDGTKLEHYRISRNFLKQDYIPSLEHLIRDIQKEQSTDSLITHNQVRRENIDDEEVIEPEDLGQKSWI